MTLPTLRGALCALLLGLSALPALPAAAHEFTAGALTIDHPWARPTLPNRPSAAYATIANAGAEADRLIAARSPAFGTIELHTTRQDGDVMKMMRVEAIELPAGGSAELRPGGLHIMLFDAAAPLAEGERFPLTLVFEKAGEVEIEVAVEKPAMGMGQGMMNHGVMGHGHGSGQMQGTSN